MELSISWELAAKLAGITPEELKGSLQTEGGELLEDAERQYADLVLQKFNAQRQELMDQYFKKGFREKGESVESALKPVLKKMGIPDTGKVEDALNKLAAKFEEGTLKGDPAEMTAEELIKLPAIKSLLDERETDTANKWQEKYNAKQQELEQYRAQTQRQQTEKVIKARSLEYLKNKGAVFGPKGADQAVEFFWKANGMDNVRVDDQGKITFLDSEGNVQRDNMSNPLTLEKVLSENWILGFDDTGSQGAPPQRKGGEGKGAGGGIAPVRSREDYTERLKATNDPAEKAKLHEAMADFMRKAEKDT